MLVEHQYTQGFEFEEPSKRIYNESLEKVKDKAHLETLKKYFSGILNQLGTINLELSNFKKAADYYLTSLKLRKEIDNKKGMASCYNNLSSVYTHQGIHSAALGNAYEALRINEELGDKSQIAVNYGVIGAINSEQENLKEALKNFSNSLKLFKELNNRERIAASYINVGSVYSSMNMNSKALENYQVALKMLEKDGDKKILAGLYSNIGQIALKQGKINESLNYYFKTIKILEESGDRFGMANNYNNVGSVYLQNNDVSVAKTWFKKGLDLGTEIGAPEVIKGSHSGFRTACLKEGNFKEAYYHYERYIFYRDSLINNENSRKLLNFQMNFEYEKSAAIAKLELDKKNEHLLAESNRQELIRNSFVIGFCITLILLFFILKVYRQKQKANKLTEEQKVIVEEKQKEILDSIHYAKRIQTTLITSEKYINKALNKLIR